jgi:hypothetical protein
VGTGTHCPPSRAQIQLLEGDDGCRLRCEPRLGVNKVRRYVRVSGASPDVEIVPFNHEFSTLRRAVLERVFFVKTEDGFARPPRPEPGLFSQVLQKTRGVLLPLLPSTAPLTHQQFVDASSTGRKRRVYQRALEDLRGGRSTPEEEARVSVFVKYEKTDHTSKSDPVPRVISPRDPRYNIRVGRYLRHMEHRVFKSLGKMFGHPTVIKGMNAVESARCLREKWEMFSDPVAVGLDASRFDQHVSLEALRWEHDIYLNCFKQKKHRDRLKRLLKLQEVNHCVGYTPDGVVKYTVTGTRMSGDMNTSLGNCVLMCSMIHAYLAERGVRGQLANNGDDCVVFLERKHLKKFMGGLSEWFLRLGFNMAIEDPVDEFERIEFCQTRPLFDGQQWLMCRNPFTALAKDSTMLMPYDPVVFRGWLDAVGVGGLRMTGGLPIFQDFYAAYIRSGQRREVPIELLPWSFRNWSAGMVREYGAVSPAARSSFWLAFGITPDEQICLEHYYQRFRVSSEVGPFMPRLVFSEG